MTTVGTKKLSYQMSLTLANFGKIITGDFVLKECYEIKQQDIDKLYDRITLIEKAANNNFDNLERQPRNNIIDSCEFLIKRSTDILNIINGYVRMLRDHKTDISSEEVVLNALLLYRDTIKVIIENAKELKQAYKQ